MQILFSSNIHYCNNEYKILSPFSKLVSISLRSIQGLNLLFSKRDFNIFVFIKTLPNDLITGYMIYPDNTVIETSFPSDTIALQKILQEDYQELILDNLCISSQKLISQTLDLKYVFENSQKHQKHLNYINESPITFRVYSPWSLQEEEIILNLYKHLKSIGLVTILVGRSEETVRKLVSKTLR